MNYTCEQNRNIEQQIKKYRADSYQIIDDNNWNLFMKLKYAGKKIVLLYQTNIRINGKSVPTVWAVK